MKIATKAKQISIICSTAIFNRHTLMSCDWHIKKEYGIQKRDGLQNARNQENFLGDNLTLCGSKTNQEGFLVPALRSRFSRSQ